METSNEVLIARARTGDGDAWDELVRRFTPLLWAVARRYGLGRQDAADAVQMTWLRLVEHLDRIRDPARIAGWLLTTCRRECWVLLRLASRCLPVDMSEVDRQLDAVLATLSTSSVDPADAVVAMEEAAAVRRAVSRLPQRHQAVLTALFAGPDRGSGGYVAVADELGIPVGSLGPTRGRALRRLSQDRTLQHLGRRSPSA
jgi:RNA polymerase sigma factor (sigma-70 family)